jgi:hypothetical protein
MGGGPTINLGAMTISAGQDDEAIIAEATRRFQAQLREGLRTARSAGRDTARALGYN